MSDLYDHVNALWEKYPPITREEAARAARKIRKRFGMIPSKRVRRCWVSLKGGRSDKGWHRLVHDLSHIHSSREFRRFRAHGPHHARIEREMVEFVLAQGWINGTLRPKVKTKARPGDEEKIAAVDAAIKRWTSKAKRAATALRKLRAKRKYHERRLAAGTSKVEEVEA